MSEEAAPKNENQNENTESGNVVTGAVGAVGDGIGTFWEDLHMARNPIQAVPEDFVPDNQEYTFDDKMDVVWLRLARWMRWVGIVSVILGVCRIFLLSIGAANMGASGSASAALVNLIANFIDAIVQLIVGYTLITCARLIRELAEVNGPGIRRALFSFATLTRVYFVQSVSYTFNCVLVVLATIAAVVVLADPTANAAFGGSSC
eukprot:TRINITY_DN4044_c0_g5_i1.p1 TRINITY_DN4044_c0_g5~~TRINITY_DN4044_c0_g5_i1.p1  ORF type:complete len:205 (-),score=77.57 TRINITY_DN4044_c0_g5_i1:576-1190(-)